MVLFVVYSQIDPSQYAIILLIILVLTCVLTFVYVRNTDEQKLARSDLNTAWDKQKNGTDAMGFYQTNVSIDYLHFLH